MRSLSLCNEHVHESAHARSLLLASFLLASPSSPCIPRCCSSTLLSVSSSPRLPLLILLLRLLCFPPPFSPLFLCSSSYRKQPLASAMHALRASPHYRNNGMVCLVLVPAIVQLSAFYLLSSLAAVIDHSGIPFSYRVHCSHQSPASRAWPLPPLFHLRLQWSLCSPRTPPMSAPCPNRQARSADLRPLQSPTLATVTWKLKNYNCKL